MTAEKEIGTDLASHASEMASMRFAGVRQRLIAGAVSRWLGSRNVLQLPMLAAFLVVLAISGLTGAQIGVVAAGVLLAGVPQVWMFVQTRRHGFDRKRFLITQVFVLTGVLTLVVATGGLASPSFFIFVLIGWTMDIPFRVIAKSKHFAIFTAIATLALLAIPRGWLGPPIGSPHFEVLVALASIGTGIPLHHGLKLLLDAHIDAAERLERLREQVLLEATSRARSLESISSKVAHELKNPLASIKGMAQLVLRGTDTEPAKGRLQVIVDESARMEVILREYLSFARPLEDLRPERIDLGMLVGDVFAIIEARAAMSGVALAFEGTASVVGDPRRIKEAMLNLVQNAVQATPARGSVDAAIATTESGARIVIRDTGAGMTPEVIAKLGTPFFTTRQEGTGLGVVLARAAIAQHGGAVDFTSVLGRGTTVTIDLPKEPKVPSHGTSPAH